MPPQDTVFAYLGRLQQLFFSPAGIIGVVALAICALMLIRIPNFKWVWIALILYVSLYGSGEVVIESRFHNDVLILPFPLSVIRLYSRELMVAMVAILAIPALRDSRGVRTRLLPAAAIIFLAFDFWMCIRLFADADARPRAFLSFVSYGLLALTVIAGIGRWMQSIEDVYWLLRSIALTAILFVVTNIFQVLANPAASVGRFWGFTSNPQTVGLMGALFLIPVLLLSQKAGTSAAMRIIYRITAAFIVLFMIWSGSRGGLLMGLVGLSLYYRWRLGPLLLAGASVAALFWLALIFFPAAISNVERLTDPLNTRADAWRALYETFRANPVFGETYAGVGYGESYFLATLAYYGLVGIVPAALALLVLMFESLNIFRQRRLLGPHSAVADWILATAGMLCVISITESALLGVWNPLELVLYFLFAAIGLVEEVLRAQALAPFEPAAELADGESYPVLAMDY